MSLKLRLLSLTSLKMQGVPMMMTCLELLPMLTGMTPCECRSQLSLRSISSPLSLHVPLRSTLPLFAAVRSSGEQDFGAQADDGSSEQDQHLSFASRAEIMIYKSVTRVKFGCEKNKRKPPSCWSVLKKLASFSLRPPPSAY